MRTNGGGRKGGGRAVEGRRNVGGMLKECWRKGLEGRRKGGRMYEEGRRKEVGRGRCLEY